MKSSKGFSLFKAVAVIFLLGATGILLYTNFAVEHEKEIFIKGKVERIDLTQTAVDGPAIVKLKALTGQRYILEIFTWENLPCVGKINNALITTNDLQTGDNVEVKGTLKTVELQGFVLSKKRVTIDCDGYIKIN